MHAVHALVEPVPLCSGLMLLRAHSDFVLIYNLKQGCSLVSGVAVNCWLHFLVYGLIGLLLKGTSEECLCLCVTCGFPFTSNQY